MAEELEALRRALKDAEKPFRNTKLPDFLQRCHNLHTSMEIVFEQPLTTQGDITTPEKRLYPKKILPWTDFSEYQATTWTKIGEHSTFSTDDLFTPPSGFEHYRKLLKPIESEQRLRFFSTLTVENMVTELVEMVNKESTLKDKFGLDGEVGFQSHLNVGDEGKGTADQFCIIKSNEDGSKRPAVAIEYKPPHKLTAHTIVLGLKTKIETELDILNRIEVADPNQEQESEEFWCKYVMAAVVTQLFSCMVDKGIRYGYICTGQVYVFLRLDDDPSNVYYSVQVPDRDVDAAGPPRLHYTAVAQVFAFLLQAIPEIGLAQDWHQKMNLLSPWNITVDDVIYNMPDSVRTNRSDSLYKPGKLGKWSRSPIKTRSWCGLDGIRQGQNHESSESDAEDGTFPESPSLQYRREAQARSGEASTGPQQRSQAPTDTRGRTYHESEHQNRSEKPHIMKRQYCTQDCLYGLAHGGVMDTSCPNFYSHGAKHPDISDFRKWVKQQLQGDTGKDASCVPLYLSGARGWLLKICLTSHGYTFVAKGAKQDHFEHLCHERNVYHQLRPSQGNHVPVCLGLIKLRQIYYYHGVRLSCLLLMSWGGRPLAAPINRQYKSLFPKLAQEALAGVHQLKVLHCDAEPRNMLFDANRGKVMVIDFERSKLCMRQELSMTTENVALPQMERDKVGHHSSALNREMKAVQKCLAYYSG